MQRLADSLESLSDVGKSYSKGLDGAERILEIQCVGIPVYSTELHHLERETQCCLRAVSKTDVLLNFSM